MERKARKRIRWDKSLSGTALKKAVEEKPDMYLYEPAQLFDCTPQAVFLMLEKLNITRKKVFHLL